MRENPGSSTAVSVAEIVDRLQPLRHIIPEAGQTPTTLDMAVGTAQRDTLGRPHD